MRILESLPRSLPNKFTLRRVSLGAAVVLLLALCAQAARAGEPWSSKLDSSVRFYQTTDVGVLVVGTEKSLYGLEAETGDVLWRRKDVRLDETDVASVPGTDILLVTLESGDKTRLEALDIVTGDSLWRSDKVRGGGDADGLRPRRGSARGGLRARREVEAALGLQAQARGARLRPRFGRAALEARA